MKILLTSSFFPPYSFGGDANHVKDLATLLAEKGNEVIVFFFHDPYYVMDKVKYWEKTSSGSTHVSDNEFSVIPNKLSTHPSKNIYSTYIFGNSKEYLSKFIEIVEKFKPDVVHHHNVSLIGYEILQKISSSYINIYTAHDFWLICSQNSLLKYGKQVCRTRNCNLCQLSRRLPPQLWRSSNNFLQAVNTIDGIICPSEFMRNKLSNQLSYSGSYTVLRNFSNYELRELDDENVSNRFTNNTLLFVGKIESLKGIFKLIDALTLINNKLINKWKLIIVGSGKESTKLENQIQQDYITNHDKVEIQYRGFVTDTELVNLRDQATYAVLPSLWFENGPLVAIEAMALGLPVISTNMGGLKELTVDNQLLIEVEEFNEQLLEVLNNLNDFSIYKELAVKTLDLFKKNYTPVVFYERYTNLIRNMMSKNKD